MQFAIVVVRACDRREHKIRVVDSIATVLCLGGLTYREGDGGELPALDHAMLLLKQHMQKQVRGSRRLATAPHFHPHQKQRSPSEASSFQYKDDLWRSRWNKRPFERERSLHHSQSSRGMGPSSSSSTDSNEGPLQRKCLA